MAIRNASANWQGSLQGGDGAMRLGSGAFEGPFSFSSRFEEGEGTNPEELIGAAHAGCFSMALANGLSEAGHEPESVATDARVHLEMGGEGPGITRVELRTRARVPGIDEEEFRRQAEEAKQHCPVSKALGGVDIELDAKLES
jgi:lipoyl-dependent peroxiredoxin